MHPVLDALLALAQVHAFPPPGFLFDVTAYIGRQDKKTKTFIYYLVWDHHRCTAATRAPAARGLPYGLAPVSNTGVGVELDLRKLPSDLQHALYLLSSQYSVDMTPAAQTMQ